jgi:hypothetical protein
LALLAATLPEGLGPDCISDRLQGFGNSSAYEVAIRNAKGSKNIDILISRCFGHWWEKGFLGFNVKGCAYLQLRFGICSEMVRKGERFCSFEYESLWIFPVEIQNMQMQQREDESVC